MGPDGEVLAPGALRREIRERAARMCERYAADEPAGGAQRSTDIEGG
ncbi:hypothetical protein [Paenibacillus thiaminolyticus]